MDRRDVPLLRLVNRFSRANEGHHPVAAKTIRGGKPMRRSHAVLACIPITFVACFVAVFVAVIAAVAQDTRPPVTFTSDEDHQNMMGQLGIKTLRPGPSGNDKAPNHANTDESLANPYNNVPDPLTMNDGRKVTTAEMWWKERRPEI